MKDLNRTQKEKFQKLIREDSKISIYSVQHQKYLDSMLVILPESAFLWQQKAMPLFKQKKYELGMTYLDKAVKLDKTSHYREYRAFIKCLFQKNYTEALSEFKELFKENENGAIMDHSYTFWMALCCLQLNQLEQSKQYLEMAVAFGKKYDIVNPYEIFYLGIIEYETGNYGNAIEYFEVSLKQYKDFADAKYYKALALAEINKKEEAGKVFQESKRDFEKGSTFNEGNSLYETFPYQVSKFSYLYAETFLK